MIDINALDFVETFDPKKGTVGIIGHGYVGKAVEHMFKDVTEVLIYDRAKPELATLKDVVDRAQVVFICVPTPMRNDGSCHTGIVESVIREVKETAATVGRNLDSLVLVIKSTVEAGFTEEMHDKYFGMRIVFSPEFLTEANSIKDFMTTNRIIIGGDEDDARVVFKFFEAAMPERYRNDQVLFLQCGPTVAEMVKLFANGMLMTKVLFANEMYQICQKLGIEYDEVRALASLDQRVGASHTKVPGPDGDFGFGGTCLTKDGNNIKHLCKQLGVPEKLFTAVLERNNELRKNHDWNDMKGRATIDE